MDTAIIRRHHEAHDESVYIQQYIELRARNLTTLTYLLEADGLLKANLQLGNRAA
ncbi:hypothetical protein [Spirosoma panaciterrae]|uniref:hypothetical protein n=1 Tax=Spirosoma panaciterrae TaxID=496058 RepID=UPI0003A012C7|nr:hypothetical protein [Spirosoma panaciterrae]